MKNMSQERMADLQFATIEMNTEKVNTEIQYAVSKNDLPGEELIRNWVEAACYNIIQHPVEVVVRLVDIEESQSLNYQYRNKNEPTNVLSFCSDIPNYVDSNELGDIVICADVVKDEAKQQNKEILAHWAHMVVHGVLHLNGYDHQQVKEAHEMEQIEIEILAKLGFPNPY